MAKVVVVIPTYNERENIVRLIPAVLATTAGQGHDVQVLVVDDNSPDGTAQAVEELARSDPRVGLLVRPSKRGIGTAYLEGFSTAITRYGPEVLVQMDADLQHPPELIPALLSKIGEGFDVVVASRYVEGGGIVGWSLRRRLVSWGANWMVRVLLGLGVHDATSGFRALSREAVEALREMSLSGGGYSYQVESLYRLSRRGFSVAEVPFTFRPREWGASKLGLREIVAFFKTVVRLALFG
jgi:glycosyltransferase involved in cell wall biosynthesis